MEHSHDSVRRGACGASVTVAFPGGARVSVEVTDEVASALRDMQRETWRIERREARHTLSLDAMDSFVPSAGPKSEPGFDLLSKCRKGELVAALAQLPAVQLRRLLMHAVAQLPVREIALRDLQAKLSDYVHRCNNFRIHSTLGYMSPVEFRKAGLILSKPSK